MAILPLLRVVVLTAALVLSQILACSEDVPPPMPADLPEVLESAVRGLRQVGKDRLADLKVGRPVGRETEKKAWMDFGREEVFPGTPWLSSIMKEFQENVSSPEVKVLVWETQDKSHSLVLMADGTVRYNPRSGFVRKFFMEAGAILRWPALLTSLFCIGLAVFEARRFLKALGTLGWPETEGIVLEHRLEATVAEADVRTFRPQVLYEYQVDGVKYRNGAVDLANLAVRMPFAERALAKYPVGGSVSVYYDPTQPARALLAPGPRFVMAVYPFAALAFGALAAWFMFVV